MFQDKAALAQLLRESIVQLCRVSVGLNADFELDAIICVSTLHHHDDAQEIVVKVHESFECDERRRRTPVTGSQQRRRKTSPKQVGGVPADNGVCAKRQRVDVIATSDSDAFVGAAAVAHSPCELSSNESSGDLASNIHIKEEPAEKYQDTNCDVPTSFDCQQLESDSSGNASIASTAIGENLWCGSCGASFCRRPALSQHFSNSHGRAMTHYCDVCSVGYDSDTAYFDHRRSTEHNQNLHTHTEKATTVDDSRDTKLNTASTGMTEGETVDDAGVRTNKDSSMQHQWQTIADSVEGYSDTGLIVRSANGHTTFYCDTCGQTFNSFADLAMHTQCAHVRYACKHCARTFTQTSSRNRHVVAAHSSDSKPFACRLCNSHYTRAHALRRHYERTHGIGYEQVHHDGDASTNHDSQMNANMELLDGVL